MADIDFTGVIIAKAEEALANGQAGRAAEWLARLKPNERPSDLEESACYAAAKEAMAKLRWGSAQAFLERANAARHDPFVQRRLGLIRQRSSLELDQESLELVAARSRRATRLRTDLLQPEVSGVWAWAAYISRGYESGSPMSRFIRYSKESLPPEEQQAMARIGGSVLCRYIEEETPILAHADVVVSVPANPGRYSSRGWSLPDELARRIEKHLGLPFLFGALESQAGDLELRGMSWADRRRAVRGSMVARELGDGQGRTVLVVDDVITSGATLREAARQLRGVGAADVLGVALTHTEG